MEVLKKVPIVKYMSSKVIKDFLDEVAVEEPLEIFIDDIPHTMTMRLPKDDIQLVIGILYSNGIIHHINDIKYIRYCESSKNRIHVALVKRKYKAEKHVHTSVSSCGVCGKLDLDEVYMDINKIPLSTTIYKDCLFDVMNDFVKRMDLFDKTGCIHAVGIYSKELKLLSFGEDIGRHNAFDKAIGKILKEKTKDLCTVAICSSRLSFEMVQKAARGGIEILAGLSAPTSMAVELANMWGITLVGFLRNKRFNVYSYPERIVDL